MPRTCMKIEQAKKIAGKAIEELSHALESGVGEQVQDVNRRRNGEASLKSTRLTGNTESADRQATLARAPAGQLRLISIEVSAIPEPPGTRGRSVPCSI